MKFNLPEDYRPYIDKYFLRAKEILIKDNLNPIVKAQVFLRKISGKKIYGINEAVAILTKYSDIEKTGHISAVKEGTLMGDNTTVMNIEAPIQSIIDLETMYLGVLSAESTLKNTLRDIQLDDIEINMNQVVKEAEGRPVSYFGARHWRYDRDAEIAGSCMRAGAVNCSTDEGAQMWGKEEKGIGTIPHALEAVYHWTHGLEDAVLNSTLAFDEIIDKTIPRIALVDYANREILDSLAVSNFVDGIRVDTCGENNMQGVLDVHSMSKGVSVEGVYILRKILPERVKIILSSGFGDPAKIKKFTTWEKHLKMKLFDGLGVGGVFNSIMATMDIIEIDGKSIHKVAREAKPNSDLEKIF